jgi:crotonobetainyl-CoA:carnitine CoA-transferase CaiB-like acyl-CoA transferase
MSPFGDSGPWADYKASDLIHLALGGIMMNCGYDPEPDGVYDTPPIAPQMWHSYHIAGEMSAIAIIAALYYAVDTGLGQQLSTAVHEAVAKQTESDVPDWIYFQKRHWRATCRHSMPQLGPAEIAVTKDGRWVRPWVRTPSLSVADLQKSIGVLEKYEMAEDLTDEKFRDPEYVASNPALLHIGDVMARFAGRFLFDREIWREFQAAGVGWAPERRPEENISDPHWRARQVGMPGGPLV